jgi:hypothetical protein
MTRDEIRQFLISQNGKSKSDVISNFTTLALTSGEKVDKLGKLISDIRSFPEWTWGE